MTTESNVAQKCIFIVGMHRSGTSALTGILQLMGVELGRELMQAWPDNPKGFFENNKIWKYNQKILKHFGSSWEDPFLYGGDWVSKHDVESFKPYIETLIEEEFADSPIFGIKDPRFCILFPLWKEICVSNKIDLLCVIPMRHPLEVARSLHKRNGFSIERGILLWFNYVFTAEDVTRGCPRVFLKFDDLFSNSEILLESIANSLGSKLPRLYKDVQNDLNVFMDRGLKHHSESKLGHTRMEIMAEELFSLFCYATETRGRDESWRGEVEKLRKEYEELFSFFLNSDMQEHHVSPQDLSEVKEKNQSLENDNEGLIRVQTELEESLSIHSTKNNLLENEIKRMRNTKIWRLAEMLRRVSGYIKP